MFRSLLVANRGEIAARVIRACRALGIRAVAVHSEADREGPWLARADQRLCIGPARAADSYLDPDAILQAAEQSGVQAVHPGYGFLAENAVFAARCEQQGLTFVGPGAEAIRRMGDKAEARRAMAAAGLATIPGSDGLLRDAAHAAEVAGDLGYPVLLKATAGGGGRGMRRCDDAASVASAFAEASREAEQAFGDAGLYLEKLVEGGRHIEFQVLCDGYGRGVHLGERECSIQRHHQKLIEESPSPALDPRQRAGVGRRAVEAALALGYRNAGTVEFLRDADGTLYFMEMNTRLQVEHPVTEMVTGVDLVVEQLRIAAGHRLGMTQDEIVFHGHAIEFRINAEDPRQGFRPDPGLLSRVDPPSDPGNGVRVRWDSGVAAGFRIPAHYDSMIGKLVVHGGDREAAIEGALRALESFRIEGVSTTVELHRRVAADAVFRSGSYDVDFLSRPGMLGD